MKNKMHLLLIFGLIPLLFSCSKGKIEVKYLGSVATIRNYKSDSVMLKMEKDTDNLTYIKEHPDFNFVFWLQSSDSSLLKGFERLGMIKGNLFLLWKLDYKQDRIFDFTDSMGRRFSFEFKPLYENKSEYCQINYFDGSDTVKLKTGYEWQHGLHYSILDIIPGGNNELVLVYNWNISNGNNTDFKVYEIKTY